MTAALVRDSFRQVHARTRQTSVTRLHALDPGLLPFTQINGSTFPAPDPTLAGLTPPVSDPDYDTDIFTFIRAQAPDTFNGQPDLQIWGAPTSRPAADPQAAWGGQYGEESDYVRTFVQRIRRKIEPDRSRPRYLFTEAGVG